MAESFHAFRNLHKCSELREAQHFAVYLIAHAMGVEEMLPHIRLELFHAQREAAIVRLNGQDDCLHLIAFLQYFRGMLHALGPAHVAYVDQSVDSILDLNESA